MSAADDLAPDNLHSLALGEHRRPCPACDRGLRDTALAVKVDDDGVCWHCHRCGLRGARNGRSHDRPHVATRARPAHAETRHATLSAYGRELWNSCQPIAGEARAYLEARGCRMPPANGDLRWHPKLKHPTGYEGPALVALCTDAVTGEPRTLHRTWIQENGRKADVDPPRLLLKGHRKAGCVVRLWPDEAVTHGLAIAEGIETCLAGAHVYAPVWSTLDAGNLSAFPVLAGIEALTIFADRDEAGLNAAQACASRWREAGREVRVRVPRIANDVCDLAQETSP